MIRIFKQYFYVLIIGIISFVILAIVTLFGFMIFISMVSQSHGPDGECDFDSHDND